MLIIIDQVDEKTRRSRLMDMYAHILGRAVQFPEMRRIVEPPMHVDSELSTNVQFADWVAACVSRAIAYQLTQQPRHRWIVRSSTAAAVRGAFTYESKLHLHQRSIADLNHSEIFREERPLFPPGPRVGDGFTAKQVEQMKPATRRTP